MKLNETFKETTIFLFTNTCIESELSLNIMSDE